MENDEMPVPLAALCARVPSARGGVVHAGTVRRWIVRGVMDTAGQRVRLRGVRRGAAWFVSQAGLAEFFAALSTAPGPDATPAGETKGGGRG